MDPDIIKTKQLCEKAAACGMTHRHLLLAHSYQEGYLGYPIDSEKSEYWRNFSQKVHRIIYQCQVASYYKDGTFPWNQEKYEENLAICNGN
ncbi:MAG: hypothetical protein CSH37_14560 [Thalassolituus sp.]|nr:MAG: hypothetical protein CSH37_14560 [Thalassolituus sp.]